MGILARHGRSAGGAKTLTSESTNLSTTSPDDNQVAAWLRALRERQPEARTITELLRWDELTVVVRAEISLPTGAVTSAIAAAVPSDSPRAVEQAENRALARALRFLGLDDVMKPSSETKPAAAPPASAATSAPASRPTAQAPIAQADTAAPASAQSTAPQPATSARPATSPSEPEGEPALEDYTWTAFWNWARRFGYQNKTAVEAAIGESITSLNPAQVRVLLKSKTGITD